MTERPTRTEIEQGERQTNWTVVALVCGLILLVLIIAYFATRSGSNPDKLTGNEVAAAAAPDRSKLCASNATYDLIKRDLFRRAAQLRGGDQSAFDQISSAAVVRMENPVMESEDGSTHTVNCSGSLSLDLPPGISVQGDRHTLSSDVDYTVQQAADSSGTVVSLNNADSIIAPLATLARAQQAAPAASADMNNETAVDNSQGGAPTPPLAVSPSQSSPPQVSNGCSNPGSRSAALVCSDSRLTALDRAVSNEYARASAVATPEMRDALRQSGRRFVSYRDRCPDAQCIAQAYNGRIREIRDIIEGRWQPQ